MNQKKAKALRKSVYKGLTKEQQRELKYKAIDGIIVNAGYRRAYLNAKYAEEHNIN